LRIGLFAHRLADRDPTGIGRYLRELVQALERVRGETDALVLGSTPEPADPDWLPPGVELRVARWPRRAAQAAWCLGGGPVLERSLGELDVVHLTHSFPPAPARGPQLVTIHDLFPLEHPEWYPRSERWTYGRGVTLALRRARRIVVPSSYVADRLVTLLGATPQRLEVVPHGVNGSFAATLPQPALAEACARFGVQPGGFAVSVGAVSTRKNAIVLVRALGRLGGEPLPLLMVGGDGHGAAEVAAEVARLDGTARVIRTGYLPDRDTAALVQAAAVLVHPALAEGFGMVPLEAMAVGTPVVAARVCSIPEVVSDAGVLVEQPADPSAWAAALAEVLGSAERRDELSAAGKRRAAAFSWERAANTMLELYRDVA
jgi:glycosyltransferase involved in cell wall biosynthesis